MNISQTQVSPVTNKLICWSPIIIGIIIALAFQALFNLLGLGMDLTAFNWDEETLIALSIGSYIWMVITGILAMFIGSWVTGLTAIINSKLYIILHGLAVWGLGALISFSAVTTTAGAALGGTAKLLNESMGWAENNYSLNNFFQSYETGNTSSNKQGLATFLQNNTNLTSQEIDALDNNWQATSNQISQANFSAQQQQAKEASQSASKVLGTVALITFLAYLLSAVASCWASCLGMKKRLSTSYPR